MGRRGLGWALGWGVLSAACGGRGTRAPADLAAKIDPIFAAYARSDSKGPGCAVGVYRAGEVAYAKGYGYADLEHDAPNTDTSRFYLASIAKQFTAAAVLLLAADGKLALGDDVRRYVPELPDRGQRITLDELLHHTSGVRDYGLLLDLEGVGDVDLVTTEDILWLLAHQQGYNFAPGTRYLYSNSGYVLLSLVVERASGKPYGAFVKERIFDPLGMTDTIVKDDHGAIVARRAVGYAIRPDGTRRSAVSNTEYTGQGNILSTVRDLARWDANFYAPTVGGPALIEGLRARGTLADGTQLAYAGGLIEDTVSGLAREAHDGTLAGYRARIVRYPTERLTVAVLCNDASAKTEALEQKVTSVLVPGFAPTGADSGAPPPASPVAPAVAGLAAGNLGELAGRYTSDELARDVEIVVSGGRLVRRAWGGRFSATPLVPTGNDAFAQGDIGWVFERDERGQVKGVVVSSERTVGVHLTKR
jgi:CubicO group peptidase (beta-lactamase class C family)